MMLGNMETSDPTSGLSNSFGQDDDDDDDWDWEDDEDDSTSSEAEKEEEESAKEKKNYWLWGAFGCGIVALGVLFVKGKIPALAATVLSLAGGALVAVTRITFKTFYEFDKLNDMDSGEYGLGKMSEMIKVNTKPGLIICIILFVIAACACLLEFLREKNAASSSSSDFY